MNARKYNVMLVNSALHIGGAENVVSSLCRNLDPDEFNVYVCYLKDKGSIGIELEREGYQVIGLPKFKIFDSKYMSSVKLSKLITKNRIDIVHSHSIHSLIDISICRFIAPRAKYVHTFHYGNYPNREEKYKKIENTLWRFPHGLVAVGEVQKNQIQKTYNIPSERLITIRNGIEVIQEKPDATILRDKKFFDKKIIGTITTLIEQKGITYLIDVAKKMREKRSDFVFLIVGDGHLREELEQKVNTLGLRNYVIFTGWMENASSRAIPLIDIFFQPSLWEAMSMVILEAMSIGKPIVATNVGENSYVVKEGETGYLVEPKDINAMSNALCRLLDSEYLRINFGDAARRRVKENYTATNMAKNHISLYRRLILNK